MTLTVRSDHSRNIGYGKQQFLFDRGESTDLALMVETYSKDERCPWDAARIRDALIREAGVDPDTAFSIAAEIEEEVLRCGKDKLNTSIIREMANVKLFQRGLDVSLVDHSRLECILYEGPEAINEKVRREAAMIALDAFHTLELRDIARIDMRMDGQGQLRVIDINPLPGLSPYYSDLPILYSLSGGNYHDLISQILRSAFNRYGLPWLEG